MLTQFATRSEAGLRLVPELARYFGEPEVVVAGLPCGGAVTAATLAQALDLPLEIVGLERLPPDFRGLTVILADDGIATTSVILAAIDLLRRRNAKRVVLAVPIITAATYERVHDAVDELICLETCEPFRSADEWYFGLDIVTDDDLRALAERADQRIAALA